MNYDNTTDMALLDMMLLLTMFVLGSIGFWVLLELFGKW